MNNKNTYNGLNNLAGNNILNNINNNIKFSSEYLKSAISMKDAQTSLNDAQTSSNAMFNDDISRLQDNEPFIESSAGIDDVTADSLDDNEISFDPVNQPPSVPYAKEI